MPIYSNLTEYTQSVYSSYLSERYEKLWHLYQEGIKCTPVLTKLDVDRLFSINVDDRLTGIPFPRGNTFSPTCEVNGPYISREMLTLIAQKYKLTGLKAYEDLKVAYNLFLYNRYLTDKLSLLADSMYNAVQFHKEFIDAVISYYNVKYKASLGSSDVDISINTIQDNGICYKSLIEYVHYGGLKPIIQFTLKIGTKLIYGMVQESDYSAVFTETSYNLNIKKIEFTTSDGIHL